MNIDIDLLSSVPLYDQTYRAKTLEADIETFLREQGFDLRERINEENKFYKITYKNRFGPSECTVFLKEDKPEWTIGGIPNEQGYITVNAVLYFKYLGDLHEEPLSEMLEKLRERFHVGHKEAGY